MPKVSVIIPVYNVENYLRECLDSVLAQTLNDIEVICVNDGSTDDSGAILDEYAKSDERVVVLHQENTGQGIARNNALKLAKGEYVAFVDPDDLISTDMYEKMYNEAVNNHADVVQCDYEEFYHSGYKNRICLKDKGYEPQTCLRQEEILKSLPVNIVFMVWSRIYKRAMIVENDIKFAPLKRAEDHTWSIESLICANKVFYIDECFYHYRMNPASTVNRNAKKYFDCLEIVNSVRDILSKHGLLDAVDIKEYQMFIGKTFLDNLDEKDYRQFFKISQKYFDKKVYDELQKFVKIQKIRYIVDNIFSLKNKFINGDKVKILSLLGVKFRMVRKG